MSARLAAAFTTCQIALGVIPSPQMLSSRLTLRKIAPVGDGGRRNPLIDAAFRPRGNRNGTDALSLANQVSNNAMLFAELKISRSKSHQFRASQSASNQQCQNRPITFASEAV